MTRTPRPGQKTIPLDQWRRFIRVADRFERLFGHQPPNVPAHHYGDDLVVLAPSGGIPARSGTTVYGVSCPVYAVAETATAGTKQLVATGDSVMVYNLVNEAVEESKYVVTALLEDGTRYVSVEGCEAESVYA